MNKQNLSTPKCPYSIVIAIHPKDSAEDSEIFNHFIVTEYSPQSYHNSQEAAVEFGVSQLNCWLYRQHPEANELDTECFICNSKFHAHTILEEIGSGKYQSPYYRKVEIDAGEHFYRARFYICYAGNAPHIPAIAKYLESGQGQDFTIDVIPAQEVIDYKRAIEEISQKWRLIKTKDKDGGELVLAE